MFQKHSYHPKTLFPVEVLLAWQWFGSNRLQSVAPAYLGLHDQKDLKHSFRKTRAQKRYD